MFVQSENILKVGSKWAGYLDEDKPDLFSGPELRDKGIQAAVEHADLEYEAWSEKAFQYLLGYIAIHKEFMAEEVRLASKGQVPEPPSKRAWGAIIVRAVKKGLIKRLGYKSVKNPTAHCAIVSVWGVNEKV